MSGDISYVLDYCIIYWLLVSQFPCVFSFSWHQYKELPDIFKLTATHWSNAYAGAPAKVASYDDLVQKLVDMGIQEVKICERE